MSGVTVLQVLEDISISLETITAAAAAFLLSSFLLSYISAYREEKEGVRMDSKVLYALRLQFWKQYRWLWVIIGFIGTVIFFWTNHIPAGIEALFHLDPVVIGTLIAIIGSAADAVGVSPVRFHMAIAVGAVVSVAVFIILQLADGNA